MLLLEACPESKGPGYHCAPFGLALSQEAPPPSAGRSSQPISGEWKANIKARFSSAEFRSRVAVTGFTDNGWQIITLVM